MKHRGVLTLALGLVLGAGSMELLHAQQGGGIKCTMLQKADLVDIAGRLVRPSGARTPDRGPRGCRPARSPGPPSPPGRPMVRGEAASRSGRSVWR